MTISEARTLTSGSLRFGDEQQCAAIALLEEFTPAMQLAIDDGWRLCPECDGAGEVTDEEYWADDEDDEPSQMVICSSCEGGGILDSEADEIPDETEDISGDCLAAIADELSAIAAFKRHAIQEGDQS